MKQYVRTEMSSKVRVTVTERARVSYFHTDEPLNAVILDRVICDICLGT